MVEWVYLNTPKINKVGYNAKIKTMYIDFSGSTVDTPYKNVIENTFQEFSQAKNADAHYENYIKTCCERVDINTENSVSYDIKVD